MAELGAITSIILVAEVDLRLSATLSTFAETVASADKAMGAISKDVSLTSSVLIELAIVLNAEKGPQAYSTTAVGSAIAVVKECSEVFQEVDDVLIEKLPKLASRRGVKASKPTGEIRASNNSNH